MKVRVLGSGTSSGVPVPGCRCAVCTSPNPRNNRLRTSIYIELEAKDRANAAADPDECVGRVLIDTSPDLRTQALREDISAVDAVLYTHVHADHVFGIDDLRSFNFINRTVIDCYASETSAKELEHRFSYAFFPDPLYEGGSPPNLTLRSVRAYEPFMLFGVSVLPLPILHGKMEVLAYRIGSFAYLTDCSFIPERSADALLGLDVLILDGLRNRPHATHFTHAQAVEQVERLKPKHTYLTHISHEVEHEAANRALKEMTVLSVELAYDGLRFDAR